MVIASPVENKKAILAVRDLDVYYGHVHVLQKVSFSLELQGVLGIVGRNGMGKTTLCNAIMGLVRATSGSVLMNGRELLGMEPYAIVDQGVGYVPQGRRVWASLTVDEHLRVSSRGGGPWSPAKVYELFPRLAERKRHGANDLSGGEQQMLAIGRALVANPKLMIMDEPTEGLAPRIVRQMEQLLMRLAQEEDLAVLLVEQNLGVATTVAKRLAVMVNGHIETELDSATLAADRELQKRLLGVSSEEEGPEAPEAPPEPEAGPARLRPAAPPRPAAPLPGAVSRAGLAATRWSHGNPLSPPAADEAERLGVSQRITRWGRVANLGLPAAPIPAGPRPPVSLPAPAVVKPSAGGAVYVVGTFDTKDRELEFVAGIIAGQGIRVKTVDVNTANRPSRAQVGPEEVASHHPGGVEAVFTGERGTAVTAMAQAFAAYLAAQSDVRGILALGGSGGTALVTPGMQALDVGVPKLMVSTMASGDVRPYVGASDICMLYSVTDVAGINRISERVLSNAANAMAGMVSGKKPVAAGHKPAIGLTMFGVTTPCVQAVVKKLEHKYDCLVFHATGTGGRSMEKLVDSGMIEGVVDITCSEITDHLFDGMLSAGPDRMGAMIRTKVPYVGSCGAAEMINFGAPETIPAKYRDRNIYHHNPQVTLVRINAEESALMGRWIGDKLNQMDGQVRYFIPEGGLSLLGVPGAPYFDTQADAALFQALEQTVQQTDRRRLIRLPHDINHPAFADALVEAFNQIMP